MVSSVVKKNASTTKGKSSSRAKNAKRALPPLLKVVVRRLPHQMKEEEFLTALAAATTDAGMGERGGSWDLIYFTPGKMSKKRGTVTGTAYLHIDRGRGASADLTLIKLRAAVLASDVLAMAAKERKHSEKGADGPMVEAAPFQKLFKQKPKRDARVGTIERDADYKAFCAALQSPAPPLPSADVQADIRESEGKEEPKPQNALLDFLKERGAKKARDSLRAAAVGTTHSSRGGSRRVSSASAINSGSASIGTSSAGAAGASVTAKVSRTASLTPTKTLRTASLTPTKTASQTPASDPTEKLKKDGEKESSRGQSRSNGGSRAPRGGSSTSRPPPPPPPPPPPDSQKSSRSGSSAAAAPASASQSSGPENKGRLATKGSGRTTHKSGKPAASSAPATSSSQRPSAILAKSNDPKSKNDPVAAVIADSRSSTSSPRNSGGGRRGAGGGGGGAGKGRMGGKASGSSRAKGGGNSGGGGGGGGGGGCDA